MDPDLRFRPMAVADLPLLRHWLAQPHVAEWWDDAEEVVDAVEHPDDPQLPGPPVHPWIMEVDGHDVGFLQWYRVEADEYYPDLDIPLDTVGIDLSIGEAEQLGRGIGRRVLPAFIAEVVLAAVPVCREVWIDPDTTNERARRAYAAAGFVDSGIDLPDPDSDDPARRRRLMRMALDDAGVR